MIFKTWQEWESELHLPAMIYDPDGFRMNALDTKYTEEEFLNRRNLCTLGPRR